MLKVANYVVMFFQQSYVSSLSVNLPHTPSHSLTSLQMIKVHPSLLLLVSRLTEMCAFAHGSGNLCDAAFIPLASQRLLGSAFIIKANNDVINHTRPGMRLRMATIWYLERFKLGQVCLHMLCKLTSMRWCSHLCCGLFWCLFFYFFYLSLTLYLWKMSLLLGRVYLPGNIKITRTDYAHCLLGWMSNWSSVGLAASAAN